jgi:hypothetical protein
MVTLVPRTVRPLSLKVIKLTPNFTAIIITKVYLHRFNTLNAELNPICHLLVLLGDLTFMGPCIVSIFHYISNKTQRYTVYSYLETALHVSGGTSTHHQVRIQLYLQPRLCGLYPGICLTTEEKARKNLSQGSRRVPAGTMKIHKHTIRIRRHNNKNT